MARGVHGMIDLTIPGGGTSPSIVEVPCDGAVDVSRRVLGSRKRMLAVQFSTSCGSVGPLYPLVIEVIVELEVQSFDVLQWGDNLRMSEVRVNVQMPVPSERTCCR